MKKKHDGKVWQTVKMISKNGHIVTLALYKNFDQPLAQDTLEELELFVSRIEKLSDTDFEGFCHAANTGAGGRLLSGQTVSISID